MIYAKPHFSARGVLVLVVKVERRDAVQEADNLLIICSYSFVSLLILFL